MVKSCFDAHIPLFCSSLQHSQLRMQFLTDVHAAINSPLCIIFNPIFCLFTSMNYRLIQTAKSHWGCCEWFTGDREAWLSAGVERPSLSFSLWLSPSSLHRLTCLLSLLLKLMLAQLYTHVCTHTLTDNSKALSGYFWSWGRSIINAELMSSFL